MATVAQEIDFISDELRLSHQELLDARTKAENIAQKYTADMDTPDFRSHPGVVFDPTFVSTYSGYVLPKQVKPDSPTEDLSTELVCKNVILSLLKDDPNLILLFILKLLQTCKRGVGTGYAIGSIGEALLGNQDYDAIFQVRLSGFEVDDDDDSTYLPSDDESVDDDTISSAGTSSSAGTMATDPVAGRRLPVSHTRFRPRQDIILPGPSNYDPTVPDEVPEYSGLSISQELSAVFLKSAFDDIEQFCTYVSGITDGKQRVTILLKSVVAFLVVQIGESRHPDFRTNPSVNLVCSKVINGVLGSGQALIAIFLMSSLARGYERVCLELAGHVVTNVVGAAVYSKHFTPDYARLLWEYHPGSYFYSTDNLPMSMEFTSATTLEAIKRNCSSQRKHPVCLVPMIPITTVGGVDVANAQREAGATEFMKNMVQTIKICNTKRSAPWRNGSTFDDLMVSAIISASELPGILRYHDHDPDPASADRSMGFYNTLKTIVLKKGTAPDKSNLKSTIVMSALDQLEARLTDYFDDIVAAAAPRRPSVPVGLVGPVGPVVPVGPDSILRDRAGRHERRSQQQRDAEAKAKAAAQSRWGVVQANLGNLGNLRTIPEDHSRDDSWETDIRSNSSNASLSSFGSSPHLTPSVVSFGPLSDDMSDATLSVDSGLASLLDGDKDPRKSRDSLGMRAAANSIQQNSRGKRRGQNYTPETSKKHVGNLDTGGGKKTKNKRKKNKPKTKRRAANKKNKKAQQHAGRVSRHNKVFRRKTRKSK